MPLPPVSRVQTEQIVSGSRMALVAASAFAIWLDPLGTSNYGAGAYAFHTAYGAYSLALLVAAWTWQRGSGRLALITHIVDVLFAGTFIDLTGTNSSPFFILFTFAMYSATLRWGARGSVTTTAAILVIYLTTCARERALAPASFELNVVLIRVVYLLMACGLLAYLGRYQERLRSEIERLARWPTTAGADQHRATRDILEHAARIVEAGRATIVWDAGEEPRVHVASWSPDGFSLAERSPADWSALVPDDLADRTLLISGNLTADSPIVVGDEDGIRIERSTRPLPQALLDLMPGRNLVSAPFRTERLSGRVFFSELRIRSGELASLTAVVAREIGTWLDQRYVTHQLQELATREERLRVARDLHDGVLQSLTGIRFELRSVALTLQDAEQDVCARLYALERALAIEQRELRYFINGLKPGTASVPPLESIAGRLDALRERLALEWNTPVSIRVSQELQDCPPTLRQAIPLMVHEAVVNALKHAQPTRVSVNVEGAIDRLRIVVSDDGRGFPFHGHFDHRALDESRTAPRSLFDRVTALGGKMSIESSERGSRVEMVVSL